MSNHIYWKLQSVQQSEVLSPFSKEFDLYRERFKKDFETRELMSETETIEHYNKHSWKQPMFSKIYSLTIAFVEKESVRIKFITGDEKDIIQTFLNTLKNDHFKEFQVTHFGAEVILPYLGTRMDLNGFRTSLPIGLIYKNLRPWNLAGLCVRDFYTGAGNYKYSLKELAWIYGLETNYIDPIDEFTFFQAGKFEELKQSAIDEIFTLVNVHRLMTGENKLEDVVATEQVVEKVEEVKPSNFLVELYETKKFSEEIKEKLKKSIKKPLKKERANLKKIITAHYTESIDVMDDQKDKDSKTETNKERTEEISQFIDNL